MHALESRIVQLENRLRRQRNGMLAAAGVLVAGLLMGAAEGEKTQERPRTLRTNRLEIVNAQGLPVVALGADELVRR